MKRVLRVLAAVCLSAAVPFVSGAQKAGEPASVLKVEMPNEITPMTLGATLTQAAAAPGETLALTVGVRLLPGWHTYAKVPPEEPYVQTKFTLEPGAGIAADGDWIAPPPVDDAGNPQLKLYESTPDPLVFVHALRVADTAAGELKVRVAVMYQTCDMSRCLPPTQQTFDLKLKVRPARK